MNRTSDSWISLWAPLLEEATRACLASANSGQRAMAAAAASVVLSRSSWEAFSNELIEQRNLMQNLKNANTLAKLQGIYNLLHNCSDDWRSMRVWKDFGVANEIRNIIVHQKNISRRRTGSVQRVVGELADRNIIGDADLGKMAWESQVLCVPVARWCCKAMGAAIVTLEEMPGGQFRMPEVTKARVSQILSLL